MSSPVAPCHLRCNFAENPLGIDVGTPRLSWQLRSEGRGARQSAWQVRVASSEARLARGKGDLWDSGRRKGDAQLGIRYAGRALATDQRVVWQVRVWDAQGAVSKWSEVATWTMGVLAPEAWRAQWITAEQQQPENATLLVRREFKVRPGLRRALIHVTGLGAYELSVNGSRVSEDLLAPAWTEYRKTVFYDTREVTALLRTGGNGLGIFLGNSMYSVQTVPGRYDKFTNAYRLPWAFAQLRLDYADGATEYVVTDERWRTHAGPVTISQVYSGEDHDARLELPGWDGAKFDDAAWQPAVTGAGPGGILRGASHAAPPIRAHEAIPPVAVRSIRPGVEVYDLGQNVALMPRLRARGAAGGTVRITGSELLHPDGTVDRISMRSDRGPAWWSYTLAGRKKAETWFPRFFYSGCRYLQVERFAPAGGPLPEVEALEGVVVHSASAPAGEFACSDDLFNRIRLLVRWAQRSNLVSLISDCPHREKLGWLEQYHLHGFSLRSEFDLTRLYAKCFGDIADAQHANGFVPNIAPEYLEFTGGGFLDSPEWGSAFILAAWQQYIWAGDDEPLREHFDAMARYLAYLSTRAPAHILTHGLGDWYDLGPNPPGESQLTPRALTATAHYYADAVTLAAIARVIGRPAEARRHRALAAKIKAAFNREFFHADTGSYATGSQTANALPLVLGIVPPAQRARVIAAMVRDVDAHGLTAGDVGYRYLLRALAAAGRSDVIFEMNHQSERPGYGYQLAHGATSLTEAWDAGRASSNNHFMLGHIMEWFYADLAGLAPDPAAPGWKRAIIRPQPVGSITWARASHESIRGKFAVAWTRADGRFTLELTVPPGAEATVHLPTSPGAKITEGSAPVNQAAGVRRVSAGKGAAVFAVVSGRYVFVADSPAA